MGNKRPSRKVRLVGAALLSLGAAAGALALQPQDAHWHRQVAAAFAAGLPVFVAHWIGEQSSRGAP